MKGSLRILYDSPITSRLEASALTIVNSQSLAIASTIYNT